MRSLFIFVLIWPISTWMRLLPAEKLEISGANGRLEYVGEVASGKPHGQGVNIVYFIICVFFIGAWY